MKLTPKTGEPPPEYRQERPPEETLRLGLRLMILWALDGEFKIRYSTLYSHLFGLNIVELCGGIVVQAKLFEHGIIVREGAADVTLQHETASARTATKSKL